jgi:hypothetical protein
VAVLSQAPIRFLLLAYFTANVKKMSVPSSSGITYVYRVPDCRLPVFGLKIHCCAVESHLKDVSGVVEITVSSTWRLLGLL